MRDYRIEGIGSIQGGEFDELTVSGVGSNQGDIKADKIIIEGVFKSTGNIEANLIDTEGVGEIEGNIRAKKITVEGAMNIKNQQKVETEELYCEGCFTTKGDLYADVVQATGCIKANGIYGDNIQINSFGLKVNGFKKLMAKLNLTSSTNGSKVSIIEATTINLSGVQAETINGHDIVIGPGCTIDTVDCSGILKVHETSHVGKILGATEQTKEII
ncbi:MAG: hypothetical protein PUC65_07465 [Clostridiales bacterium]|nr:hypothetical protein [Clostridiales bacterium]